MMKVFVKKYFVFDFEFVQNFEMLKSHNNYFFFVNYFHENVN